MGTYSPAWLSGDSSGFVSRYSNTVGSSPTAGSKLEQLQRQIGVEAAAKAVDCPNLVARHLMGDR